MKHCKQVLTLGVCSALMLGAVAQQVMVFTPQIYARIEDSYGSDTRRDVANWQHLMDQNRDADLQTKLIKINSFFNQYKFIDDLALWGKADYWATPIEFIASSAGDCEDFSIAKYMSLIAMGVEPEKLRLMYVKSIPLNQPHMVLAFYPTPTSVPLVLDNLKPEIVPASERTDLSPVYSFNAQGLWIAKNLGQGRKIRSGGILLWNDMIERLNRWSAGH